MKVKEGNFEKAYQIISESSALPAVCGRVCPQESQCEGKCIRGSRVILFQLVSLKDLLLTGQERMASSQRSRREENGKKRLLLSVQVLPDLHVPETLQKMGYDVTIFEALHAAGGVLSYGIPEFRLPKDKVVAAEVENVKITWC